ncbi:MAG TPA: protein kinase [Kofleriaceae bacterium]|nr:protein kinase [Kofleriaceae bacterium]
MAERQFGPYRLVRQIAVGGMAEIHLAKTAGLAGFEKYVALKMIHPNFAEDEQFIQMLVDEAKIAVQLTHGNIAQTFDLGRVGDTYYITMEYVDGADLYKILRRASEQDREMPLDVCAFIGKEISSALDHAHRKRDHTGKSLGIVHRDVSPQNVLVSYSGEVKLVDFGIAKATMKVRQTAVGVIKGKYYYMSPEQAWGDPIDHRSDIFSAGIVLYEMITGQMLYLEEDLHKLLEMARAAAIEPPSRLRRGVPPQLERIVMHALERVPGERYQSAGDLATDLERFLHAYSPVFTSSKLSTLVREVVGDPLQVPDDPAGGGVEQRDGVMSTHPLDDAEVAHATDRGSLRDENSVIFRVAELDRAPKAPTLRKTPPPPPPLPGASVRTAPPKAASRPTAPRVTRAADPMPLPERSAPPARLPPMSPRATSAKIPHIAKPRQPHEETRRMEPAPANPLQEESGLITPDGKLVVWDDSDRDASDEYVEGAADRTVITAAPIGMGFMMDVAVDDGDGPVEATMITSAPVGPGFSGEEDSTVDRTDDRPDDDAPTVARELAFEPPTHPARPSDQASLAPPAALQAKIHAPAISELRKPRPSRRTPAGGGVRPNVLQAIVSSQASEPMPAPRPAQRPPVQAKSQPMAPVQAKSQPMAPVQAKSQPMAPLGQSPPAPVQPLLFSQSQPMSSLADSLHGRFEPAPSPSQPPPLFNPVPSMSPTLLEPLAGQASPASMPTLMQPAAPPSVEPLAPGFPVGASPGPAYADGQGLYTDADGSGTEPGFGAPPGAPPNPAGVAAHLAYPAMQPMPAGYSQPVANQMSPHGYPQLMPGALYSFQAPPQEMSLTGQLRAAEIDELPAHYRLGASRARWFTYIVSGVLAVSVAAAVTFLIIRSMRDTAPQVASVYITSVPAGADVLFEGTRLRDKTPLTIDKVPVGTRPTIRLELAHYGPYEEILDIPRRGAEVKRTIQLMAITGKIVIDSVPAGAEIHINGRMRGRTPTTINDVDMDSAKVLELRLKDYQLFRQDLAWPADGKIQINAKLVR